jgi:hypothetical protein
MLISEEIEQIYKEEDEKILENIGKISWEINTWAKKNELNPNAQATFI